MSLRSRLEKRRARQRDAGKARDHLRKLRSDIARLLSEDSFRDLLDSVELHAIERVDSLNMADASDSAILEANRQWGAISKLRREALLLAEQGERE